MRDLHVRQLCMAALAATACAGSSYAATRTVAKSGTPDFATVQAAIEFFTATDPDPGTTDTIQITDSAVYDEQFFVKAPVVIQGTGASRPVLCVQRVTQTEAPVGITVDNTATTYDGFTIGIPAGTQNLVELRNLIFIPSTTNPPVDDLIRTVGQNLAVTFDNVVVSPNNGSNVPVSTDGLTQLSTATPVVPIGDDGVFVGAGAAPAGVGFVGNFRNTVITHTSVGANADGLVLSSAGSRYNISDGCVFSFNGRLGIQSASDLSLDAQTTRVLVKGNKGFAGIWFAAVSPNVRSLNGINVIDNGASSTSGWGIEQQNAHATGLVGLTLKNAIISNNTAQGIEVGATNANGPILLQNVTIAKNGRYAINVAATNTANISIVDSIIAGNGSADAANNTINHNGTGTMSYTGSAVVTGGPQALATAFSGTGPHTGNPITLDPAFVQTANHATAGYYNVQKTNYATANSVGGPLGGGAAYVGGVSQPTAANDWQMFE